MAVTSVSPRETPASAAPATTHSTGHPIPARPSRHATDDEILGLDSAVADDSRSAGVPPAPSPLTETRQQDAGATQPDAAEAEIPESLRAALDANPDLRRAWDDAQAYRESFASPDEARTATALLADLDRMDALFFSRRPEDHAELARAVANLDPAAFASLAQAMNGLATSSVGARYIVPGTDARRDAAHSSIPNVAAQTPQPQSGAPTETNGADPAKDDGRARYIVPLQPQPTPAQPAQPTAAQTEFFHATNAAAVESVLDAIESQVERLLPEGVSKSARNRVVGEIYRELDTTLRSNRQLAQQMRDGFRTGSLDAEHQRALVSLVTGRARQALPGVAKRVLGEWTSTIVAANHDRRARQQAAERRVDIAGSGGTGSDGSRSMAPRDIDYRRMSDADILNL